MKRRSTHTTPMQFQRLQKPLQRVASNFRPFLAGSPLCVLAYRFAALRLNEADHSIEGRRHASVKAQGAYRVKPKRTIPKKLGAKKTGDQYVIPGNIIYKQRGTVWHPGENTHMGRDHTIHAAVAGYVKYYRDPAKHPNRQYIGVVFDRDKKLPYPAGIPRVRKLGMFAAPRRIPPPPLAEDALSPSGLPRHVVRKEGEIKVIDLTGDAPVEVEQEQSLTKQKISKRRQRFLKKRWKTRPDLAVRALQLEAHKRAQQERKTTRVLHLQKDYGYREYNWEIGRIIGPVGKVGGTGWAGTRRAKMRAKAKYAAIRAKITATRHTAKKERKDEIKRKRKEKQKKRDQELADLMGKESTRRLAVAAAVQAKLPEKEAEKTA